MATSDVAICNMALQKLGAARITSLTEDSRNARACNACFEMVRDRELRARAWNFAKKRETLAPHATAPAFDFAYAFPVPSDFLRLLPPARTYLDWSIENHQGVKCIMTNDGDSIEVIYIAKITDPTLYDPLFDEALACKLATHMCEEITQSNQKKADTAAEYKAVMAEARQINAYEQVSAEPPEDPYLAARR